MTKLIDADALTIAVFKKAIDDAFLNGNTDMHRLLIQVIAHQPTIDAEPVIRCKDCEYWLPHHQFGFDSDNEEYHDYCEKHLPDDDYYAFEKSANDYCSWAKPKED